MKDWQADFKRDSYNQARWDDAEKTHLWSAGFTIGLTFIVGAMMGVSLGVWI